MITNLVSSNGEAYIVPGKVNGERAEFLPDTGAEVTVVPQKFVCEAQMTGKEVTIQGVTGFPECTPLAMVNLEFLGEKFQKEVAVSSSLNRSNRVLYSLPLGGILPELLLKCVREQEKATQSDVKFEIPDCDEIQSRDRESVSDNQSGVIGDCKQVSQVLASLL